MNRNGFTLLELAIVLGIIAIMTHLAVREASKYVNLNRRVEANRQLESIRDAITGQDGDFESGFFSDLGRLPRAVPLTNENGQVSYTLAELWQKPDATHQYTLLQASTANLVSGDTANFDNAVYVPCGWRGPYLRLPLGKNRLFDPWGNPYETPDAASGKQRLRGVGDVQVVDGGEIAIVRHLGADGVPDSFASSTDNPEARDCAITNETDSATALMVSIVPMNADGAIETALPTSVYVYGPRSTTEGMKLYAKTGSGTDTVLVTGLQPGVHIMKVRYNSQNNWPAQRIVLRPGLTNSVTVKLSVPSSLSTGGTGG